MTKLHQVLAADKDIKKRTDRKITDAYQRLQKPDLYSGLSRTYTPKDENGEVLPPQTQILQRRVSDEFEVIEQEWTDQINSAATKDFANTQAKADIVVDGETILAGAPVPFLLWLEGEIRRMIPVVTVAPILDPSEKWEYSDESRSYETNTTRTLRTTKQNVPLVLAEATDKHPAQVQVFQQDVVVGSWDSKRMSGALSATEHEARLDRFGKLLIAVQQARAEANEIAVTPSQAGEAVTSYLFG